MNQVILIGRAGKDPEIRHTQSGQLVAKFSVATTEKFKDKEHTEWHNVVAWGVTAEIVQKRVSKGCQVMITGKIENRSYDSKDGKKYITEIIANRIVAEPRSGDVKREFESKKTEDSIQKWTPPEQDSFMQDSEIPF